jgi:hypothetical protein
MLTPADLRKKLQQLEDTNGAITVYKEVAAIIKEYQAVQQEALEQAAADMQLDGVLHHKGDLGSAGWTKPKTPRLDKAVWAQRVNSDTALAQLQAEFDEMERRLKLAQEQAGCWTLPEPRFYIR